MADLDRERLTRAERARAEKLIDLYDRLSPENQRRFAAQTLMFEVGRLVGRGDLALLLRAAAALGKLLDEGAR